MKFLLFSALLLTVTWGSSDTEDDSLPRASHELSAWSWKTTTRGCPDPNSYGRVCKAYIDQCNSDQECRMTGKGNKCCLVAGCGRSCMN
nr:uncharacterized protein LOC123774994 [Procambarus clarkii]